MPVKRGLAAASPATRARVASLGGRARHAVRGLAAANIQTRRRVARLGGRASRGGGRRGI